MNRQIDRTARAVTIAGWVFVGWALTLLGIEFVAAGWLPDDIEAFRAAIRWGRITAMPVAFLIGVIGMALTLADLSRCANLSSRRARARVGVMAAILAMATLTGSEPITISTLEEMGPEELAAIAEAAASIRIPQLLLILFYAVCHSLGNRSPLPVTKADGSGRYASAWVPPIFGETPLLPGRQWQVLGLLVVVGAFNYYDLQVLSLALKQIQADLAIAEADVSLVGSLVRLGAVPGVLIAWYADAIGRRRILLVSIIGYTTATGLTAIAPNTEMFLVCQMMARMFGAAESVVAGIVVAEEIDAKHRGWAIGVLAGMSGAGNAMAWILFPLIDSFPMGWRGMFLVGLGPLAIVAVLRQRLPETQRFEQLGNEARVSFRALVATLGKLPSVYRRRFVAALFIGFFMAFSGQLAGFLFPKMLQDNHGLEPANLTYFVAAAGFLGLCFAPILGRVGDRYGRRKVAIAFAGLNPFAVMLLFNAPLIGIAMIGFLAMMVTDAGSDMNLSTYGKELFPTSIRATIGGLLVVVAAIGGSAGLAVESLVYVYTGSHATAVSAIALTGLVVPFIVWRVYPETAGRELDQTAPEL